jgi:predicted enzyme related to lactoylglutathione lyase
MAETATVAIGAPGWVDLGSTDPEASRKFYSDLFNWSVDIVPAPEAGGYGMFKINGKEVGGVGPTQDPKQPTAWLAYILVDDAKATAKKVKDEGGTVITDAMDVMGEGTMAVIADPTGAVIGLWQPGRHRGFEVQGSPGSVTWVELSSRDLPKAEAFYRNVFGWDPTQASVAGKYTEFKLGGNSIAGGMDMSEMVPDEAPSYWLVYFAVADADEAAANARKLGGKELVAPTDIPQIGRFAVLQDPQGATFGLLQGSSL